MAAAMAEAAAVCLEEAGHQNGVPCERWLRRNGRPTKPTPEDSAELRWKPLLSSAKASWNDLRAATEYGAYALAALQVYDHLDRVIVQRSRIGTGFDFWLGSPGADPEQLFQKHGRLEVSGLLRGELAECQRRIKKKLEQIGPIGENLPGFVAVVEFGQPRSWAVEK
ncbi:MAG: hypothetical protein MI919_30910 [Holophagales bacterium]|nr:hypothetical protein [Holophagales bacterium]